MIFDFYIEGLNREISIKADSEKEARREVWESITETERNVVVQIECIDERAV